MESVGPKERRARARSALGRVVVLASATAWGFGACATIADPGSVAPPAPTGPIVAPGPISAEEEARAYVLLQQAEASFEAARYLEVLRLTSELLDDYAASEASGAALLLSARAEAGAGAIERADAVAERYIDLLAAGDPRAAEVRLFQAEILTGQPAIQLDRLLRIPSDARDGDVARALPLVRAAAESVPIEVLELVVDAAPRGGAASWPAYARLSVHLLARGDEAVSAELARAAVAGGATGEDLELVEGVLRGELPDSLRAVRAFEIATVLPLGGPPALADFARLVAEGIEVAVATVLPEEYTVTVRSLDDEADPVLAAGLVVDSLEAAAVAGVVGFLQDDVLLSAAQARSSGLPMVSPTARSAQQAGEGVYSLEGADPLAAARIGRYAASHGFQRVAMIHPSTPDAYEEAEAFSATVAQLGVPIVGTFTYPAGATHFETQLKAARDALRAAEIAALGLGPDDTLRVEMLAPVGIFMPIPAEDVEFVAPQFAHFGLDTLAIEVIGTSGWTDPQARAEVDARLITGIVATAPVGGISGSAGYERFRLAYEAHFQRTLVSPTPALGYDATLLLLEALRPGRIRPPDVQRAFEQLSEVEGATGRYVVLEGRVLKVTEVVVIQGDTLVPIPEG